VAVGVMDQETEEMIVWTIVVLLVTARIAGLCVGMTVIAWMIAAWMIVVLLVTAWMIVVHPCVGMIEMNADQGVVMLGNQVQAEDPLGAIGKSKRNNNGHQEITNSLEVGSMTVDLGTVMTADQEIVMTADHHAIVMNVGVGVEEAGATLPVMTEVDLNEGMIVALETGTIEVHLCAVMTAERTEEVAEVGEVHHEMTADHHQCVETTADREIGMTADLVMIVAEVMTAGMEDSVVVTAIVGTTVEDEMTAARTTGDQDLVDFHLHHVMTAEEEEMIKEKTEVKDSLQGMMDLLSVLQNQNRNLHKEEKLQMDGPLLSNDNL